MPFPSTTIQRFELGTTFREFDLAMNRKNFIGANVFRPRMVSKNAANVGKVKLEQLLATANETTARNAGAGYKRDTWQFDQFSYAVQEYGKESPIDDSQLAMYRDILDAEQIHADRAQDAVLNEYERDASAAAFNTTTFTGTGAGGLTVAAGTSWKTYASADPVKDVYAAIEQVASNSGLEANALILNRKKMRDVMLCAAILDRVKYTEIPTAEELRSRFAELFDVKYVLVAGGFKNIANAGAAASVSRIWSDSYAMVARVAESDDPQEPCIGRTFIWDGDGPAAPGDGGQLAVVMEQYREESERSTIMRARNNRQIVMMYAKAGCLITGVDA